MHWSEQLGQWIEKTMGRIILVFVIAVLVSVGMGVFIGLVLF